MTHSVSRGTPFSRPPRPITARRTARVADVDDPRPEDCVLVDAEHVLVVDVVVEEGSGQVVARHRSLGRRRQSEG
jgi:hypothetical protein